MKINTGKNEVDLGFPTPEPGTYVLEVDEGVSLFTNDNTGKTSLKIPFKIVEAIEGDDGSVGMQVGHFVPIETEFGERQLAGILTLTGLIDRLANKFGQEVEVTNESFINVLKLRMPGKFIKGYHELRKDMNGKDRASIVKFEKIAAKQSGSTQQEQKAANTASEDW